ncbi:hypothetical protein SAMN04489724_2905 [Algoriphagus locisalis]|uniref:Uncharacterized protein n=1 Tax=Algoriphagus locisalis TaxID=305507 RepID=A0A1I7C6C0_9BACT|nr:hypothetical protein [Algoriphagus locisalis]SFT94983.1 hypothetical protein SAMN04489724_2905 [Algoriphagus locisalis]
MNNVTNYNIGNGSRTIIASEVNTYTTVQLFIPQHLSKEEQQNPIQVFSQFFEKEYPLPRAKMAIEDMALKVAYDIPPLSWKVKEESIYFILQFSRLLEAAYLIRNESRPCWKVEKISKENMVPKEVLNKGRKLETIFPYILNSHDPQDAKDPCLNLQVLFYDTPIQELLDTFKTWGKCVSANLKVDKTHHWNSHLDLRIFTIILESCHLIYVRSQNGNDKVPPG